MMKQIRTPNYNKKIWTDRTNRTYKTPQKWDMIVNHIMEGYAPQTIDYIDRPDITVSAHFIIGRKGEIWRQADLKHGAWHCIKRKPSNKIVAGRSAPPNIYTVGIEHEGMHKDTKGKLTDKQYEASLWVHKYIIERYEATFKEPFPIDRDHIIGHYEVDTVNRSKTDPGHEFPWDKLLSDLKKWDKLRNTSDIKDKVTATIGVHLRQDATATSKSLLIVQKDGEASMIGLKDGWLQLNYNGKIGFSFSTYWDVPEKVMEKFAPEPPTPDIKEQSPIDGPFINEDGERLWFRSISGSHQTREAAEAEVEKLVESGFANPWIQAVYIKEKK